MQLSEGILKALDSGDPSIPIPDRLLGVKGYAVGYVSEYAILKQPGPAERASVGWGIYLNSQHHFEQWQGGGWVSPATEWWRGSSYANEDLPSDYLGYYAAARYRELWGHPEVALQLIALQLGGGRPVDEPQHAGGIPVPMPIGFAKPLVVAPVFVSAYWGDSGLKNHDSTPRVHTSDGWQNIPWPTSMQIAPTGEGTYWQYQQSYNTFYTPGK